MSDLAQEKIGKVKEAVHFSTTDSTVGIESREAIRCYYKCCRCDSEWTSQQTWPTRCKICGTRVTCTQRDPKIKSGPERFSQDAPIDENEVENWQKKKDVCNPGGISHGRRPPQYKSRLHSVDSDKLQAEADELFDMGNMYFLRECYEMAVEMYTEAIDLSPRYHMDVYYMFRSRANMELNKFEEAEKDLHQSLKVDMVTCGYPKCSTCEYDRQFWRIRASLRWYGMDEWWSDTSSDSSDEVTDEGVDVDSRSPRERTFKNFKTTDRRVDYNISRNTRIRRLQTRLKEQIALRRLKVESEGTSGSFSKSNLRSEPEMERGHSDSQGAQVTDNNPGDLTDGADKIYDLKDEDDALAATKIDAKVASGTSGCTRKSARRYELGSDAVPVTVVRRFRIHSWLSTRPRQYETHSSNDEPSTDREKVDIFHWPVEEDEDLVSEADSLDVHMPEPPDLSSVQEDAAVADSHHAALSEVSICSVASSPVVDEPDTQSARKSSCDRGTGNQPGTRVSWPLNTEVGADDSGKTKREIQVVGTETTGPCHQDWHAESENPGVVATLPTRVSAGQQDVGREPQITGEADRAPETIVRRFRIHSWLSTRPTENKKQTTTGAHVPDDPRSSDQSPPRDDLAEEEEPPRDDLADEEEPPRDDLAEEEEPPRDDLVEEEEGPESETDSMDTHLPELPDLASAEENEEVKDLASDSLSAVKSSTVEENPGTLSSQQQVSMQDVMDVRAEPRTRVSLLSQSGGNADALSQGGSSDSSGTGRVVEKAGAGVDLSSASECSADPDGPNISALIQGRDEEKQTTIDIAHHEGTLDSFMLVKTASSLRVDTVTEVGQLMFERDRQFVVEAIHELGMIDDSYYRDTASIAVSRDFIVVKIGKQLLIYDIMRNNAMQRREAITEDVVDIAGMGSAVYCLLRSGEVVEYSVPGLEQLRRIPPPRQKQGDRFSKIATCSRTNRTALLSVTNQASVVKVYDGDWSCINTVHFPDLRASWYLCLFGDELLIDGQVESVRSVVYNNYSRSVAAILGFRNYDAVQAICHIDTDRVLVVTKDDFSEREFVRQLDLDYIRERSRNCPNADSVLTARREDLRWVPAFGLEGFTFNTLISSIRTNICDGKLMEMSDSGRATLYDRDVSCPGHVEVLCKYRIRLPLGIKVRRFDISHEGEVVVISPDGRVLIFSIDRMLRWYDCLAQTAWDVVCTPDIIYVLVDDSVIEYRNENGCTAKIRCLSGGLENHDPRNTRLVVHGHVLYLLVPERKHVLSMNLREPEPSFTEFVQIPHVLSRCLAVTREGEVLVGGAWVDRSTGTQKPGLIVYAPDGMPISRWVPVESEGEDDTLNIDSAFRHDGGLYYMTSLGSLKFLDNFQN